MCDDQRRNSSSSSGRCDRVRMDISSGGENTVEQPLLLTLSSDSDSEFVVSRNEEIFPMVDKNTVLRPEIMAEDLALSGFQDAGALNYGFNISESTGPFELAQDQILEIGTNDLNNMPDLNLKDEPCSPSSVMIDMTNVNDATCSDTKNPQKSFNNFDLMETSTSSASEINTILDNFNAILENAELNYEIHDLQLNDVQSRDFIVKSMENLSDLLAVIGDDDKETEEDDDLLIIVETETDCSDSDNNASETEMNATKNVNSGCLLTVNNVHNDEIEGSPDTPELEEGDQEEGGYESDRPMMGRPSMRKLKPIQMMPIPSPVASAGSAGVILNLNELGSSSTSKFYTSIDLDMDNEVEKLVPFTGLATTLNCPTTNMMLVTSLINNVLSSPAVDLDEQPSNSSRNLITNGTVEDLSPVLSVQTENRLHVDVNTAGTSIQGTEVGQSSSSSDETGQVSQVESGSRSTNSMGNILSGNDSTTLPANSASSTTTPSVRAPAPAPPATITRTTVIRHASRTITIPGESSSADNDGDDERSGFNSASRMSNGQWPHRLSSVLALLGCTLGLNNICRFSLLSVQYGANFTIQFLILSCVIGIPLFTFHMSIGQYLNSGIIDMWKISPIFQGIGIGLVISQAMIGIYSAVGVSWMFIYFRDSFITRFDQYRWGKCFHDYRGCDPFSNQTSSLAETVPDYFNGVVLQRSTPDYPSSTYFPTSLKFTVAFNLAVVWMLIFVSLSKGLKSYGKVIHGFVLIPIVSVLILASKMVGIVPTDDTSSLFGQTDWNNFFFNSQTWVLAAREAFFTWGILGACVMQITSHNRYTHSLKSDASIVILITTFVLFLTAFIGNACHSILLSQDYNYVPSSFESLRTYQFLVKRPPDLPPNVPILPSNMYQHTSFLMGVRIMKPEGLVDSLNMINTNAISGYQALRIATELYPTTMAILGSQGLSPFWTVLFYFTFILFGIAQQLAIWHCLIKGVIAIKAKSLKSWETTITFFVCAIGFGLGLPLCTELGIFIIYFLDYCIGSGWWVMVLYLLELVAVFVVRGAPYCGENIVTVFMTGNGNFTKCFAPLLSFVWNVILPVTMLILSIASFKSGNVRELYDWSFSSDGYIFWPSYIRELGSFIQLIPILTVPFVAIVQSCRYLTNGPSDLFDRMQQLYRPHSRGLLGRNLSNGLGRSRSARENSSGNDSRTIEDPPPKYTPPPSYSTATSARIAKFLRASIRRSLRRISNPASSSTEDPPPPNYASVVLEIHNQRSCSTSPSINTGNIPTITISNAAAATSTSTQMSNANDNLLPILSPITLSVSALVAASSASATVTTSITNEKSDAISKSKPSTSTSTSKDKKNAALGQHEFNRSSIRRIASDITPSDVARILRATFQKEAATNTAYEIGFPYNSNVSDTQNDPNASYNDFSLDKRQTSIDSDQFYSCNNSNSHTRSNNATFLATHCRTSSFPTSNFYNNFVDFSRCSRRSNDSQIALILDPSRRESLSSDILSNDDFLSSCNPLSSTIMAGADGIVNPAFQLNNECSTIMMSNSSKPESSYSSTTAINPTSSYSNAPGHLPSKNPILAILIDPSA